MKQFLTLLLAAGVLAGCSTSEEGTGETVKNEGEQTAAEVEESVNETLEEVEESANDLASGIEESTEEIAAGMEEEMQKAEEEINKMLIGEGEEAVITRDVYAAATEEAYDEMFSYLEANDYDGIKEMNTNGEVVFLEKGTEVKVVNRSALRAGIETADGRTSGYLPVKLLELKTTE